MRYIVKVADRTYEVDIENIHARPVIARVDGQTFEVSPENGVKPVTQREPRESKTIELPRQPASPTASTKELTAPLPGTVIEIFVKPGQQIESGQVLLVIEAMKMKNSIRSIRSGTIAEILVSTGETVTHKQSLVRYE